MNVIGGVLPWYTLCIVAKRQTCASIRLFLLEPRTVNLRPGYDKYPRGTGKWLGISGLPLPPPPQTHTAVTCNQALVTMSVMWILVNVKR